jgi:hypothetical protein
MMNFDRFKLSKAFYTRLDYAQLKDRLSGRIGLNFKRGVIDNDIIFLYYLKDAYTNNGLDRVPFCCLEIKNEIAPDGLTRVDFSVANFAIIIWSIFPILFSILIWTAGEIPILYALVPYPVLYSILYALFSNQADKFEKDLKELEKAA